MALMWVLGKSDKSMFLSGSRCQSFASLGDERRFYRELFALKSLEQEKYARRPGPVRRVASMVRTWLLWRWQAELVAQCGRNFKDRRTRSLFTRLVKVVCQVETGFSTFLVVSQMPQLLPQSPIFPNLSLLSRREPSDPPDPHFSLPEDHPHHIETSSRQRRGPENDNIPCKRPFGTGPINAYGHKTQSKGRAGQKKSAEEESKVVCAFNQTAGLIKEALYIVCYRMAISRSRC